jgi:hypothetical protein
VSSFSLLPGSHRMITSCYPRRRQDAPGFAPHWLALLDRLPLWFSIPHHPRFKSQTVEGS